MQKKVQNPIFKKKKKKLVHVVIKQNFLKIKDQCTESS